MKVGGVIGKSKSIIKSIWQHTDVWINVHKLIPEDEEWNIEISDTRRRMDYYEKGFGVEWVEECREFLVGGWVWESTFSLSFLLPFSKISKFEKKSNFPKKQTENKGTKQSKKTGTTTTTRWL